MDLFILFILLGIIVFLVVIASSSSSTNKKRERYLRKLENETLSWKDIEEASVFLGENDNEIFQEGVKQLQRRKIRNPKEVQEARKNILEQIKKDTLKTVKGPDLDLFWKYQEIFKAFKEKKILNRCSKCDGIGFRIWELNPKKIVFQCSGCQNLKSVTYQRCTKNKIDLNKLIDLLDKEIEQYPEYDMKGTNYPKYAAFSLLSRITNL